MGRTRGEVSERIEAAVTDFGERIRAERIRRGLSVDDVANALGMSHNTVLRIERGNPHTAFSRILTIAEYLEVTLIVHVAALPE